MPKSNLKNQFSLVLAAFAILILVGGGFLFFLRLVYPTQSQAFLDKFSLWRQGVQWVESSQGVTGIYLDRCHGSQQCHCIAFVHGLGDDAFTWRTFFEKPAADWQVPVKLLAMDLPGMGRSGRIPDEKEYQVRRSSARIANMMSGYCSIWTVVGNDAGSWLAIWMALDQRELVSKLVLTGTVGFKSPNAKQEAFWKDVFAAPTTEKVQSFYSKAYAHSPSLSSWKAQAIANELMTSGTPVWMKAQIESDFLNDKLSALTQPALMLWGKSDQITPLSYAKLYQDLVQVGVYREVGECGHYPQKECPQVVFESILQMLHYGSI